MGLKVSVIVPAFNEERFLARTLASLTDQTFHGYELLVVDNGSTDATAAIARRFADRVILETRRGYMNAAARGAAESTGELLTFCDADTLYPRTWLARMVRAFARNPAASAVYGSCRSHDASPIMNRVNGFFFTQWLRVSRLLGLDNTSGFNLVIRRSAFEAVGGYDRRFAKAGPDVELGRRLSRVGPIVFRADIRVEASARRFRQGGVLSTLWMFTKIWWRLLRGRVPRISYDEYNATARQRKSGPPAPADSRMR